MNKNITIVFDTEEQKKAFILELKVSIKEEISINGIDMSLIYQQILDQIN